MPARNDDVRASSDEGDATAAPDDERRWVRAVLCACALAAGACKATTFTCEDEAQCKDGAAVGVCQPNGFCSFPDDACGSGQRFGAHSGELSGRCVPEGEATSSGSSGSSDGGPTTTSTTIDPSIAEGSSRGESSSTAMADSSSGAPPTTDDSTGEGPDPSLLIHIDFEGELAVGLVNHGSIGGVAACEGDTCPAPFEGPIGSAGVFDGLDDCARIEHVPALAPEQFTLAMWAYREVPEPGFDAAFTKPVGMLAYNTWRMTLQGDPKLGELLNVHVGLADDMGVDGYASLPLGEWKHFAATWTGDALTTYVDGVFVESLPSTLIEVDEHPVYVGCDDDHDPLGLVHFVHGALDDVRMYDRVLDEAEIAELHALAMP